MYQQQTSPNSHAQHESTTMDGRVPSLAAFSGLGNSWWAAQLGHGNTAIDTPQSDLQPPGELPAWAMESASPEAERSIGLINASLTMIAVESADALDLLETYLAQVDDLPWYVEIAKNVVSTGMGDIGSAMAAGIAAFVAPESAAALAVAELVSSVLTDQLSASSDNAIDAANGVNTTGTFTAVMRAEYLSAFGSDLRSAMLGSVLDVIRDEDPEGLADFAQALQLYAADLGRVKEDFFFQGLQAWLNYGAEATASRIPGFGVSPGEAFTIKVQFEDSEDGVRASYVQIGALPGETREKARDMPLMGCNVVIQGVGVRAAGVCLRLHPDGSLEDQSLPVVGEAHLDRIGREHLEGTADDARKALGDWARDNTIGSLEPGLPILG